MDFYRPTWVEIDLKAVAHNINEIGKKVKPSVQILAMVKADAYGHGGIEIIRELLDGKKDKQPSVSMLGVALIEEGIQLRQAGFNKIPILILGSIYPFDNFNQVVQYD